MDKYLLPIIILINLSLVIWSVDRADEVDPVAVIEQPTPIVEELPDIVEEVPEIVEEPKNTHLGEFKLTAYCPCERCSGNWGNMTATGTKATAGRTVAVDPKKIPYGTELIINGNTYIAEDCGGAIEGNKIDIYFDSHKEALNFGVQYAEVYKVG